MALKIMAQNKGGGGSTVKPGQRLWLTSAGKLVEDGHPQAASLYCSEFASVQRGEYNALVKASSNKSKEK